MTPEELLDFLHGPSPSVILSEYVADRAADLAEAEEMERRRNKVNWQREGF
jgi:hypothetical protein